jgi:hypothetical protein
VIKKVYIYTLINPINDEIFYVGYSENIKKRYIIHLRTNGKRREKNLYKDNIINKILKVGLKPEIKIIDIICLSMKDWKDIIFGNIKMMELN